VSWNDPDPSPFRGPGFFGLVDVLLVLMSIFIMVSSLVLTTLETTLQAAQIAPKPVAEVKHRIIIPNELNGRVLFDSGSAAIKPEFYPLLNKFGDEILALIGSGQFNIVEVQGYTDNVPLKAAGRYHDNWELAAARALSVVRYLSEEGIAPAVLSSASFGEHSPRDNNATIEGRANNRRIEVLLLRDSETRR
jgi:flagellar motor protein MotB